MFLAVSASLQAAPVKALADAGLAQATALAVDADHADDQGHADEHGISQDSCDLDEGMIVPDAFAVALHSYPAAAPASAASPGFIHPGGIVPRPPSV